MLETLIFTQGGWSHRGFRAEEGCHLPYALTESLWLLCGGGAEGVVVVVVINAVHQVFSVLLIIVLLFPDPLESGMAYDLP